jgi:enoyl-CoA hydratase/carnithine racemase
MADELVRAFDLADADQSVRAVVLTGTGDHFCAGADLSDGTFEVDPSLEDPTIWQEPAGRCALRIYRMNKPVVAALRGFAIGAGATIPLAADIRVAADDLRLGYVFGRRGIYPEGASTWFLPKLVGLSTAMDWMLTGRLVSAAEAESEGLVRSTHSTETLLDAAHAIALDLAQNCAPVSLAVTRRLLLQMSGASTPEAAQQIDSRLIAGLDSNSDALEGVTSFLERRPAHFPGRVPDDVPHWLPWMAGAPTAATQL